MNFDDVYRKYKKYFSELTYKIVRLPDGDAHEEIQQLFWIRVAKRIHQYDVKKGASLRTWLIHIFKGEVTHYFRKSKADKQRDNEVGYDDVNNRNSENEPLEFQVVSSQDLERQCDWNLLKGWVKDFVEELSSKDQIIFYELCRESTATEIAKQMKISRTQVVLRIRKIRQVMRKLYKHELVCCNGVQENESINSM